MTADYAFMPAGKTTTFNGLFRFDAIFDGIPAKSDYRPPCIDAKSLKAGMALIIEAGTELTLKACGGIVKLDPSGVTWSPLRSKAGSYFGWWL